MFSHGTNRWGFVEQKNRKLFCLGAVYFWQYVSEVLAGIHGLIFLSCCSLCSLLACWLQKHVHISQVFSIYIPLFCLVIWLSLWLLFGAPLIWLFSIWLFHGNLFTNMIINWTVMFYFSRYLFFNLDEFLILPGYLLSLLSIKHIFLLSLNKNWKFQRIIDFLTNPEPNHKYLIVSDCQ